MALVTNHDELLRLQGAHAPSAGDLLSPPSDSAEPTAYLDSPVVDDIPDDVVAYALSKLRKDTVSDADLIAALLDIFGGPPLVLESDSGTEYRFADVLADVQAAPPDVASHVRTLAVELRKGNYSTRPSVSALASALSSGRFNAADATTVAGALRMRVVINEMLAERRERAVSLIASAADAKYANNAADDYVLRKRRPSFDPRLEDALTWYATMEPDKLNRAVEGRNREA